MSESATEEDIPAPDSTSVLLAQLSREREQKQKRLLRALMVGVVISLAGVAVAFVGVTSVQVFPSKIQDSAKMRIVRGIGYVRKNSVYTMPGELVLAVEADGFYPGEIFLPAKGKKANVELTLRELPGRLIASTSPPRPVAQWWIDGIPISTGATLDTELPAGIHTLAVDSYFDHSITREVDIIRGKKINLEIELQPVMGRIEIATTPAGATILIDGEQAGTAPGAWDLIVGEHTLEARLPGYASVEEIFRISKASPGIQRSYRLRTAYAQAAFFLRPEGGDLLVDGELREPGSVLLLEPGDGHHLLYKKIGYLPYEENFSVGPGERLSREIDLQRMVGSVKIESNPPARITINGKPAGTTPATLSLGVEEHEIVFSEEGYVPVTRKVTPLENTDVLVQVKLETVRANKIRTSPAVYTNPAGMKMRLFRNLGSFEMGSRRGELDRRANEHSRQIKLTRMFYAAEHETTVAQISGFRGTAAASGSGNLPVTRITWDEAARFCNWLSQREGLAPFYRFNGQKYLGVNRASDGYRLPTEAEWEWLARKAGRARQTIFAWGDEEQVPAGAGNLADESASGQLKSYISKYTDGYSQLAPVGKSRSNPSGLYDLVGNVREWTHDAYTLLPPAGGLAVDPRVDAPSGGHTIKGSSWRTASRAKLRAAFRNSDEEPFDDLGFRVVRYLYGDDN